MTALAARSETMTRRGWPFQPLATVRVRHDGVDEVFVAGEFNRWQLPGVPMERRGDGTWEARVELTVAEACRFACFVLDACGFHAIAGATIDSE